MIMILNGFFGLLPLSSLSCLFSPGSFYNLYSNIIKALSCQNINRSEFIIFFFLCSRHSQRNENKEILFSITELSLRGICQKAQSYVTYQIVTMCFGAKPWKARLENLNYVPAPYFCIPLASELELFPLHLPPGLYPSDALVISYLLTRRILQLTALSPKFSFVLGISIPL